MTAKRVTIGLKPISGGQDTPRVIGAERTGIASSARAEASPPEDAVKAPVAASAPLSIEDWLHQGRGQPEPAPEPTPAALPVAAVESVEPPKAEEPQASAEPAPAPEPMVSAQPKTPSRLPPWFGIAASVAAGAAAALAVVFLVPPFLPSTDLRVAPLFARITSLEGETHKTGAEVGRLNNEIAQVLDGQENAQTRLAEQNEILNGLKKSIARENDKRVEPVIDASSPIFAVALGQLRTTFYAGRPFEAELVNLYAIAGNDDRFSAYLTQLSGPARTGVPNAAELKRVFPSYVAAAGLRIGNSESYYQYGMSLVNRYVGVGAEPYPTEIGNLAVTRAEARLAAGDVAGAMRALNELDQEFTTPMTPWLDAARNYLRMETVIADMTGIVTDNLRRKLSSAGGKTQPAANPAASSLSAPAAKP